MHKYLALTIGPIYKTAQKAKRTQALWGASYLFSYFMQEVCAALQEKYQGDFVTPLVSDHRLFEPQKGAGLFPDRLIIRNGSINELQKAISTALEKLSSLAEGAVNDTTLFRNYLEKYLLLAAVETEAADMENIIEKCNRLLSVQELQQPFIAEEDEDLLAKFLENLAKSKLPEKAFGDADARFPSVVEISASEFGRVPETRQHFRQQIYQHLFRRDSPETESNEEAFLDALKQEPSIKKQFRRYHKYIAIVKADGDNLGKTTEVLYQKVPDLVPEIGKLLLDFNCEAVNLIDGYGGRPVFLGGDDVLFFAPVRCQGRNVFDLVRALSGLYAEKFNTFFETHAEVLAEVETRPTLSFGVSMSYYKFPMHETLDIAENLLSEAKDKKAGKNGVAFRVSKHSGQYFQARQSQSSETYTKHFPQMIALSLSDEDAFLSSVIFALRESEYIIRAILEHEAAQVRLTNYFENSFNEDIHQTKKKAFIDATAALLFQSFTENGHDAKKAIDITYATLRLAQFMNQKDLQNDERE